MGRVATTPHARGHQLDPAPPPSELPPLKPESELDDDDDESLDDDHDESLDDDHDESLDDGDHDESFDDESEVHRTRCGVSR